MWYHPAAHKLAWHDVAGAWLACAVIVISAIGFVEFDAAMLAVHHAARALHAALPAVGLPFIVGLLSPTPLIA
jgi:hypothetical protein